MIRWLFILLNIEDFDKTALCSQLFVADISVSVGVYLFSPDWSLHVLFCRDWSLLMSFLLMDVFMLSSICGPQIPDQTVIPWQSLIRKRPAETCLSLEWFMCFRSLVRIPTLLDRVGRSPLFSRSPYKWVFNVIVLLIRTPSNFH